MLSLDPDPAHFSNLRSRQFKRRDLIPFKQHLLWRVDAGIVRTLTWDEEGTPLTLGFWGAGDLVGDPPSDLDPYEIECLTPVQVSLLPAGHWYSQNAVRSHIQQAAIMLRILHCKRMRARLQQLLDWLGKRFGCKVEQGTLLELRLTHQAIADIIGSTRVTVTRLLHDLEAEGKVNLSGQYCILLDNWGGAKR